MSAKKINRGVVMKKHKTECTALILLLGILCYAFYDSNIKGSEQSIVTKTTNEQGSKIKQYF